MDTQHSALNARKQQATPRGVGVMCQWYAEKAEMPRFGTRKATNLSISLVVLQF